MRLRSADRPVFYRVREGKRLHAFGDPILEVPVLGRPLGDQQRAMIESNGCELRDVSARTDVAGERCFIFDEDLCFTSQLIAAVLRAGRESRTSLRFGLAANPFNDRFALPHDCDPAGVHRFNLHYIRSRDDATTEAVVPQNVLPFPVSLPDQIVRGGTYRFDQCATFLTRLASPFHLLQANLAVHFGRLASLRSRLPAWVEERLAPVHSRAYVRGLRSLNRVGRHCRVHRSAVLENAVLEEGVVVGANSTIRHAYIGAGTVIDDNVVIVNSVLGKRNAVASGNQINLCVTYEDVFLIHGPYQFSIFGKSSAVFAVINCDIRLDQRTITIPTDVGMLDSRQPLLGIAYGHHSKVGGGNIIAAGRIVPNHRRIDPPATIILKVD
jgi:hypothetical protein